VLGRRCVNDAGAGATSRTFASVTAGASVPTVPTARPFPAAGARERSIAFKQADRGDLFEILKLPPAAWQRRPSWRASGKNRSTRPHTATRQES
jgi:hypothetical protein